ncbi:MAG: hypothetical protein H0X66_19500 [Verrucomicrobia bacterium]|nr:hypothetical protein [Verrucomicrobiota bacterium]
MKIKANNSNFEACPEFTGKAVCVDVTPLRRQPSQFGERDVFKIVFEVDMDREDGSRYCVWSRNFTPSLNEKANLRKFVRGWLGRDLTAPELNDFDTESLIGKNAQVVVVHEHKEGETYANIVACTPDKSGAPLVPTGKYVRVKDRDTSPRLSPQSGEGESSGGTGTYRRAQPAAAPGEEHNSVKIHVGRCKGLELRDLAPEQVQALIEKWLPTAKANAKPTADDKRLIAGLDAWAVANQPKEEDEIPY